MNRALSPSEINHLHRLLGWVRCEIWQSPEELKATLAEIAPYFPEGISDDAKVRLLEQHRKAESVPKYVRQAVKMLSAALKDEHGDIVDAETALPYLKLEEMP